jgi:hypothetical protein
MAYVRSKMRSLGMKGRRHKGPLREVREVIRFGEGLFDHDSVIFICGHKGRRTPGAKRGRCAECKRSPSSGGGGK